MKNRIAFLIFFIACWINTSIHAQITAFDGTSFSFIAKDGNGQQLTNQSNLSLVATLHANSATGAVLYSESHTINIPNDGVVSGILGQGTATLGTFSTVDWAAQDVFLVLELNNVNQGAMQFFSVPYAQVAKNVLDKDVVVVTQSNYQSINVNNNDIVRIDGNINNISGIINNFQNDNLTITGGELVGTGTSSTEIRLGNYRTIVQGVSFKDLKIKNHERLIFINCYFDNVNIDATAVFKRCNFEGNINIRGAIHDSRINLANINGSITTITNSDIEDTNFNSSNISSMNNNEIRDCIFTGDINRVQDNYISGTHITVRSLFSKNNCSDVSVSNIAGNNLNISNNIFRDKHYTQNQIITINHSHNSAGRQIIINHNQFIGTNSNNQSRFIFITGNYTNNILGQYVATIIQGNTFKDGTNAFISSATGRVRNFFVDNVLMNLTGIGHPVTPTSTPLTTINVVPVSRNFIYQN